MARATPALCTDALELVPTRAGRVLQHSESRFERTLVRLKCDKAALAGFAGQVLDVNHIHPREMQLSLSRQVSRGATSSAISRLLHLQRQNSRMSWLTAAQPRSETVLLCRQTLEPRWYLDTALDRATDRRGQPRIAVVLSCNRRCPPDEHSGQQPDHRWARPNPPQLPRHWRHGERRPATTRQPFGTWPRPSCLRPQPARKPAARARTTRSSFASGGHASGFTCRGDQSRYSTGPSLRMNLRRLLMSTWTSVMPSTMGHSLSSGWKSRINKLPST